MAGTLRRHALVVVAVAACTAAVLVAVSIGAAGAGASNTGTDTWSGTWSRAEDHVAGNLILTQTGNSVSGHYTWNDGSGKVVGSVSGSTFNGSFNETHYSGSFRLVLKARSFIGTYTGTNKDTGGPVSGPFDGQCVAGPCRSNGAPSTGTNTTTTNTSTKPGPGTLVITGASSGEISARGPDGNWHRVPAGATLDTTQEISTGIDSQITVALPDGDTFQVNELTQVLASSLINNTRTGRTTLAVQFKLGEIKAQVKSEIALDTSLQVSPLPYGQGSVRDSEMDVFVDPLAKIAIFATLKDKSYWRRGKVLIHDPPGQGDRRHAWWGAQVRPDRQGRRARRDRHRASPTISHLDAWIARPRRARCRPLRAQPPMRTVSATRLAGDRARDRQGLRQLGLAGIRVRREAGERRGEPDAAGCQ